MIILDTNIISEIIKSCPFEAVVSWLDQQFEENLFITSITLAEIRYGFMLLPHGKRRHYLEAKYDQDIHGIFASRTLPFDKIAAEEYARLMSHARKHGKAIAFMDGQIASIARAHKAPVATRDVAPFIYAGVKVINPWQSNSSSIN